MARKKSNWDNLEPQKSSAAQFITYVASVGESNEKFEIRYEDENIWMSQKMLAAVYGVEVPNIAYHLRKIFEDAELEESRCIKEILIDSLSNDYQDDNLANILFPILYSDFSRDVILKVLDIFPI